jgi:MerR family copper efflux transcriptional regulator
VESHARHVIGAPTIRFYEQEGLLDSRHVQRQDNNYRDYSERAVGHLLTLKKLQAAGFTLAEIKAAIQADVANELSHAKKVAFLRQKMQEIERKMVELEQIQAYLAQMLAHKITAESEVEM